MTGVQPLRSEDDSESIIHFQVAQTAIYCDYCQKKCANRITSRYVSPRSREGAEQNDFANCLQIPLSPNSSIEVPNKD